LRARHPFANQFNMLKEVAAAVARLVFRIANL
jgi:hypothetical protein